MPIAAFVNHDLLCSLFSPVTLPGPWIFHSISVAVVLISTCFGVHFSRRFAQLSQYTPWFAKCFYHLRGGWSSIRSRRSLELRLCPSRSSSVTSSFNTCFNLHFTSPPFLFKLFPFVFGLATACHLQDRFNRVHYLFISENSVGSNDRSERVRQFQ